MSEMVRYGILPNPYTPGVMIDFYGNPISSGGAGWPTVNGAGPGNLVAETPSSDTVGYNLTDQGTGGIHISATGTVDNEGIELLYSGAAVADNGGIALVDNSAVSAGIDLVVNDTDNPGGIALTNQGAGGIQIEDGGSFGIFIQQSDNGGPHLGTTRFSGTHAAMSSLAGTNGDMAIHVGSSDPAHILEIWCEEWIFGGNWLLQRIFAETDPITQGYVPPNAGIIWQWTGGVWISNGSSSGDWFQVT